MSTEIFRETYKASDKNNFIWDDQKVKEFYTYCYNNVFKQPTYLEEMIEKFKASKQQSKDWEIVKWVDVHGIERCSDVYIYNMFSNCKSQATIKSVRRLSDGEVFTVGDWVDYADRTTIWSDERKDACQIKRLSLHKGEIFINSHYMGRPDRRINEWIKKAKQSVLFTTHDNVDIYEGDEYWNVDKENENDKLNWLVWNGIAGSNEFNLPKHNPYKIYFSTESAAKEWVSLFKKNYSKNSICEIFNIDKNDSRWHKVKD